MNRDDALLSYTPIAMSELAHNIGHMLEVAHQDRSNWPDDDLLDFFEFQLAANLQDDLGLFFDDAAGEVARSGCVTFGDLLTREQPSLPLLQMVRLFTKKLAAGEEHAYPADVALALYFSVIAAAEARLGELITSMSREELRSGYAWTKTRSWLPTCLGPLFEQVAP